MAGDARRAGRPREMPFHPLSEIFPPMSDDEFAALKADIAEHGQLEMIVTLNGAILDGRNRYLACVDLGVQPRIVEWSGIGSPQAFVISHNLHRRHLNESQRGLIAARLATRTKAEAAQIATNARIGKDNVTGIPTTTVPTIKAAAKLLNVSPDTVSEAKKVLQEGTAEEIAAIERGDVAVTTTAQAIRANLSPSERKAKQANPHADRTTKMKMNGQLWGAFRDAINNLSGLPSANDMLRIVKGSDKAKITGTKLPIALKWLEEFSDAWNRS